MIRLLPVFLLLALMASLPPPAQAREAAKELTAVTLRHWPPQYLTNEKTGRPAGFAIEVMEKIAALSGLKIRYLVCENWPEAIAALQEGRADLSPNLGITPDRLDTFDFTTSYQTFRIRTFVREDSVNIRNTADLAGRKVGVVRKNRGLQLMEEVGGSQLQVFDSQEQLFLALLAGNIEALVYPDQPMEEMAREAGLDNKIKAIGAPFEEVKRAIAVRKGEAALLATLDTAVKSFIESSDYQDIYRKWYGQPNPYWTDVRVLMAAGAALGATVVLMLLWHYLSVLKLNRRLAETEKRFREIVEHADAGYFFLDTAGIIRQVNQAWLSIHGYDSAAEVVGQHFAITQVDADLSQAEKNVQEMLAGKIFFANEFSRRCRDGTVGYHSFSAHPVLRNGRVIGIEGFIIDANERHRAAEALRESEEKHRFLFENAADPICVLAPDGAILAVNEMVSTLLGYGREELLQISWHNLLGVEEKPGEQARIVQLLDKGLLDFTTLCRHRDGKAIPIEVHARRIDWEGWTAMMCVCRDITWRKNREERAIRAQKVESLSRMAGAIAHHFNNQLTVVMGNLELALDELPQEAGEVPFLNAAMQAARKSSELSGLMLTYIGQGGGKSEAVSLADICQQNLPLLRDTLPGGISLDCSVSDQESLVLANPGQLRIILDHLITNAVEAIGKNSGQVSLSLETLTAEALPAGFIVPSEWQVTAGEYVCLSVQDNGCGIPEEVLGKIFDPFFSTKFTGRGLGLSVVLGLVKTWGGAINVHSRPGEGSDFRLIFPLSGKRATAEAEPVPPLSLDDRRKVVLLADDDQRLRQMGEKMLERLGFACLLANDGREAVELFRQHQERICCVVTDLTMPNMDGWETIAALRQLQPGLPVVLASGYDEFLAMSRDKAEQPQAFLHKPFSKFELQNALSRAMRPEGIV